MLDTGQIGRVTFVCSCYFRDANPEAFRKTAEALAARHQPLIATRNHSKLLLMATSRGDWLTVESSANLRSCKNIEQSCMTSDRELYDFYTGCFAEIVEQVQHKTKPRKRQKNDERGNAVRDVTLARTLADLDHTVLEA